jgi:hypothetical protein
MFRHRRLTMATIHQRTAFAAVLAQLEEECDAA